jgi:copper(I)-binding protein
MSAMHPVSSIHIPAGGTVSLAPGGFHLMLMGPKPLAVGDTVELVLTFEKAGKVTVKAEVKNG